MKMHEDAELNQSAKVRSENWFKEEFEDFESVTSKDQHRKPTRVWAKAGFDKELVFIDDRGFSIWEHSFPLRGDSRNWITCIEQTGKKCPFCECKIKRFFNTFYSVIETSGHWGGNDIWYQNKRRLFCAQPDVARIILKHKRRLENSLVAKKFQIGRGDYSSQATERCFNYIESVQLSKYNSPRPFDYRQLFAPLSAKELKGLLEKIEVENIL